MNNKIRKKIEIFIAKRREGGGGRSFLNVVTCVYARTKTNHTAEQLVLYNITLSALIILVRAHILLTKLIIKLLPCLTLVTEHAIIFRGCLFVRTSGHTHEGKKQMVAVCLSSTTPLAR